MSQSRSYNIQSVSKTNLYRAMKDRIMSETGMSKQAVQDLIGPMVESHINQQKQQERAMEIAVTMIQEDGGTDGLVVQAGGKVVAKSTPKPKATKEKKKKKRKGQPGANNNTKLRTAEAKADVQTLLELFHRAFHEHSQDKHVLAKTLGVSDATISNWLGCSVQPADRNLPSIAEFLSKLNYTVPIRFYSGS